MKSPFHELWEQIKTAMAMEDQPIKLWDELDEEFYQVFLECAAELEDQPKEKPILERKREWAHTDQGPNKDCWRVNRPIFTAPEKAPDECHGCANDEWYSKGIVTRDKNTKQIVDKERDRAVKSGLSEIVRSARRW